MALSGLEVPLQQPSLLCIHGAANGAWVWDSWRRHLSPLGWAINVVDLRGHGRSLPVDFSTVTMNDYVADVESVAGQIAAQKGSYPVLLGWSMGGLIAMMYAMSQTETPALVLFAPSPPMEVAGRASGDEVKQTPSSPFGPELYGIYPNDFEKSRAALFDLTEEQARLVLAKSSGAVESGFARRQRKRGVSVSAGEIRCPSIVIYGDQDTAISPSHSGAVADHLGATAMVVPGLGHWGILYNEEVVAETALRLDDWLRKTLQPAQS